MNYDIKDPGLAPEGKKRIDWAEQDMPVLREVKKRFNKTKPLAGIKIAACLHVTSETANLMITLKAGGADTVLCASNPLSTQDDVAASLVVNEQIPVFAVNGEDNKTYFNHVNAALDLKPHITMDDGADLVSEIHKKRRELIKNVKAGTEETTTGVIRLKALAKQKKLTFPILAVNDAQTKHLFDNRYGTGQSTIDGIIRATNRLLAGSTFVVAGYGWCGKGVAMRARGLGANVIVTEINPVKALEARMDGFRVMPMMEAAPSSDFICTLTGNTEVVGAKVLMNIKDGCIISNSGHFNNEIDIGALDSMSKHKETVKNNVELYTLKDGRKVYLLGEGRLINLASAEGHPASVMDMSFANQALGAEYMLINAKKLARDVHVIPAEVDEEIARIKLRSLNVSIDALTARQKKYLESWEEGTE
ncbi:MAG: adenosylhomocysteinase [Candidatus Taylorbacteria bacterium RIFCSPLOWO2_12_FULL_43_20]|uniref:Adenosylhomocysteinase n=1 Tax=Candidatus Taylorbacteria bacterium RIFCSPLOWO2_12_FULL_43_20 TaxID=1802332 RepID=A0A1G2P4V0_9BACT|nr:MAG: adenosylhomocysteinase [Candidatus Taylorbacteria bacterium RIFCSPHIGHO2_01_FULL_43_120]OHA22959.1 MAG: adenosylhomocysteinase [Candidatus Taylorbacteria bacterium RIFCSPHIGHO2_02_FULL_43_55]OHA30247.1 MAG: adenosylhomocysteinase [Candidatus Taylorbacteria bacterium RIFCSPHIGHO2_12_FULL_42_34]OHA31945.1 MAG: adenosylhomocysteinase [Candidatus Taylorbacteria bacterium RIFCSPLOWO2_01_FULL_43_83]OHA37968.1 MAG: adenosylhomocysteinase [Candidatus Taylorbacteria bacterium RIFCSPLOWO2_02_FULL